MDYLIKSFGQDYTAYIFSFLAYFFWMGSLAMTAENHKINFAHFGIWRGFSIVLFNFLYARNNDISLDFKNKQFIFLSFRNLLTLFHTFFIPFSLHYLSQPLIQTISCSIPIIVFLLDHMLNNIHVSRKQFYGIVAACISLIIMINSTLILLALGYSVQLKSNYKYTQTNVFVKFIISFVLLLTLIAQAYAIILMKKLKGFNILEINVNLGFLALMIGTILSFYFQTEPMTFYQSIYSFYTVGIFTTLTVVCFNLAITITKKLGNVTIISFTTVIHGYLLSILRYDEAPNVLEITGSIILLIGLVFVLIK